MNLLPPRVPATVWAVGAVLLSVISVQTGASIAKTLFSVTGPAGITALRTAFAAVLLAAVWRPWRGPGLNARRLRIVALYGVTLGYMNLCFYLSLQRLPLGLAVAIEFLGPLLLTLGTSRRLVDFLWLCLAFAGLAGLLPVWQTTAGDLDPLGVVYALAAGACWALYIVFGQKASAMLPGGQAASLGMAVAALATLPFGLAATGPTLLTPSVLGVGVAVAVLSSAIPYPLEMVALRRLPTRTFGILLSLDPALAAVSGLLLLGESLSPRQCAAVVAVVVASLGSTLSAARRLGEAAPPAQNKSH